MGNSRCFELTKNDTESLERAMILVKALCKKIKSKRLASGKASEYPSKNIFVPLNEKINDRVALVLLEWFKENINTLYDECRTGKRFYICGQYGFLARHYDPDLSD
jgi:hypothetical protein